MTKAEFLEKLAELYRVGNKSDSDAHDREDWTKPQMAHIACAPFDQVVHGMRQCGAITDTDVNEFYGSL